MSPIAWAVRALRFGRAAGWAWGLGFLLLVVGGAALLGAAARGETGAPALEPDGVWRAHGDWVIGAEEVVVHADERVEALGNVTLMGNASLSFVNSSLTFGDAGGSHFVAVNQAALTLSNSTAIGVGGAYLSASSGKVRGDACTLRFEGSSGTNASIRASGGGVTFTDCQVQSDAGVAVESRDSDLRATDCDFAHLNGTSADVSIAGKGVHELDTTRFATLHASEGPGVTLYVTVRFFLENPQGEPVTGHVNGTGAYGEIFSLDNTPNKTVAMRFTWVRETALSTNLTEGTDHGPFPLVFTASNAGTGGNTSSMWLTHHRENVTVPLDRPFDLAITTFIVQGRSLSGPPLKRAYYLQIGTDYTLFVQVANQGAAASPPTTLTIFRTALDASSWVRTAAGTAVEVAVPAIAAGDVWGQGVPVQADTFGGLANVTETCSESASYTSLYSGALAAPLDGDYAGWNNERMFVAISYEVLPVEGQECTRPNNTAIATIGVGFAAAVGGAALIGYQFSEKQVARRAAKASKKNAERPKEPPTGKP